MGCVPPAAVAVRGGLHQAPPGAADPPDQAPPNQAPPLWTDTHLVNILPCPKLRLRAVIMIDLINA